MNLSGFEAALASCGSYPLYGLCKFYCKKEEIDFVKSHQVTGRFCELRNNTPLEKLKSGMGDIFIKLAR